jgi:hypothetical protein
MLLAGWTRRCNVLVSLTVLLCALAGCSESLPTPPTPPPTLDVSGRWVRLDSNGPTAGGWQLTQRGMTVEGTSLDDPAAPVPYAGVLTGSVAGSEFTFSGTTTQFFPERSQQTTFGATLTVTANTMTGLISSVPPVGRPATGPVTYVRVVQGGS